MKVYVVSNNVSEFNDIDGVFTSIEQAYTTALNVSGHYSEYETLEGVKCEIDVRGFAVVLGDGYAVVITEKTLNE